MKRFLLMVSLLMAAAVQAQVKFGVHLGAVRTNAYQIETAFLENDPVFSGRTGLMGGASLQVPLGKKWTYETGLSYMGKTVRYASYFMEDWGLKGHERLHYLVLNQNWFRQVWGNRRMSVHAGLGLYGAFAFGGSYQQSSRFFTNITEEEGSLPIGTSQEDRYRRCDWGGNLLLRVQYKQWQLTGQFSPSITDYDRHAEVRLKSFGLSVGYLL
jgi:hypothetical protein